MSFGDQMTSPSVSSTMYRAAVVSVEAKKNGTMHLLPVPRGRRPTHEERRTAYPSHPHPYPSPSPLTLTLTLTLTPHPRYLVELNKEVFPEVTSKAKRIGSLKSGPEFTPIGPLGATYNEFGPGRSTGRRTRGVRVGASVAPATMFLKDKGLNSMEVASSTNKLLCHKVNKFLHFERFRTF